MFHMLACFDLDNGVTVEEFREALNRFTAHLRELDLVDHSSPVGQRQRDTILDTDEERDHRFFATMTFRDRAQADAATDYIQGGAEPGSGIHREVYAKVRNPIFICWQDL